MTIPFDKLDHFYFNEFIPSLHPLIQDIAIDRHFLRHEEDVEPLTSIAGLYQQQYIYMPWLLLEHFPMSDKMVFELGKAWILKIIDFVITDNIIDKQVPDNVAVTLYHQQLRNYTDHILHTMLGESTEFWSRYFQANVDLANVNALEIHCVVNHNAPYTLDVMKQLYRGRSAFFISFIYAMGELSGDMTLVQPLSNFYEKMALADQLLDDAADWRDDFREGRYTLPVVMALEVANIDFFDAEAISESVIDKTIITHEILQSIADMALSLFSEIETLLEENNMNNSHLSKFIQERIALAQHSKQRYNALGILDRFSQALL